MALLKFITKRLFSSLGYEFRRIGIARGDPQLSPSDPVTSQYQSDLRPAPIVEIQLSHARAGVMGFPLRPVSPHPYLAACIAAARSDSYSGSWLAARSVLAVYYSRVCPRTALDVLDLSDSDAPGLIDAPVTHWLPPWSEHSIMENLRLRSTAIREEGLTNWSLTTIDDGMSLFGPVSQRKLDLESRRIAKLVASIRSIGFKPTTRHIPEVLGLRVGSDYRWFVVQGQHRLAACVAFGFDLSRARVTRIIRREDAPYWPQVAAGTFRADGALKVFDRVYSGLSPGVTSGWRSDFAEPS